MKRDIRKGIKNSFLYKRFAYNSDGFIELVKFLEDKNLIDKFYEECNFNKKFFIKELKVNRKISLGGFFGYSRYSFSFARSKFGEDFWYDRIIFDKDFQKICDKVL